MKFKKIINIFLALDIKIVRPLFLGVAAGIEHKNILSNKGYQTVIDIGANRGQFSLIARHCFPIAHIVAFEPLEKPAKIFRLVFKSDLNATLYEAAIGTNEGKAVIHISKKDDSSSLLPITSKQDALFPGTSEKNTAIVNIGALNEYISEGQIKAPALLKLDVQGYELESLKGCEELLHKVDHVYVECSFLELYKGQALASEVIYYLRQHGLDLEGIYNVSYDKKGFAVQADFLFGRRKGKE